MSSAREIFVAACAVRGVRGARWRTFDSGGVEAMEIVVEIEDHHSRHDGDAIIEEVSKVINDTRPGGAEVKVWIHGNRSLSDNRRDRVHALAISLAHDRELFGGSEIDRLVQHFRHDLTDELIGGRK